MPFNYRCRYCKAELEDCLPRTLCPCGRKGLYQYQTKEYRQMAKAPSAKHSPNYTKSEKGDF